MLEDLVLMLQNIILMVLGKRTLGVPTTGIEQITVILGGLPDDMVIQQEG